MLSDFLQVFQYTGPKRFLTSAGVILMFLSIFLPWFMISQALAFDITTADFNQLTEPSQYNALARQYISLVLIASSCCLSPILAVLGIMFATASYWAWFFFGDSEKEKQSKSEKTDKPSNLPIESPIYMVVPFKPEKDTSGKTPSSHKQESQSISATSEIVVAQSPDVVSQESNRSIKVNSYALFVQKLKEILSSPNILKSEYSVENDDWFDVVLSSQSESPDILIKTTHIFKKDLWNIVRFYRLLIKEWADHNESRKAKVIGVILYSKLSLPSHIVVWLLNRKRLLIFFKLEITILLLAEKMLNEKNVLSMIQKNLPVNIS